MEILVIFEYAYYQGGGVTASGENSNLKMREFAKKMTSLFSQCKVWSFHINCGNKYYILATDQLLDEAIEIRFYPSIRKSYDTEEYNNKIMSKPAMVGVEFS